MDYPYPIIPYEITVHLGRPEEQAQNVRVPFVSYIKNVASSEIYPTWPENALRANIHAQVTFALNRIDTEWYRSRGYNFDITNSTQYDQAFVPNREIFRNVADIVDELFDDYVRRIGYIEPLFTQYCNGTTSTCDGLSQWGTVTLSNQGKSPLAILQNYYGTDIEIVSDAPTGAPIGSYPGTPLQLGSVGEEVRTIQLQLNRIARNYPSLPRIEDPRGVFDEQTQQAVTRFQEIFNLTPDGIVGPATWYRIKAIYTAVKGLSELVSEGISLSEAARLYPGVLRRGNTGIPVGVIQYYLAFLWYFYDVSPPVDIDGVFGPATENAVRAFQRAVGLADDGIVGRQTFNALTDAYDRTTQQVLPVNLRRDVYPGRVLLRGSTGESVRRLQELLNIVAESEPGIIPPAVTGTFGEQTDAAVRAFERANGLRESGLVGPLVWTAIVMQAYNL